MEERESTIFTVTVEAVGRRARLPLSAWGLKGAPVVSLLSARYHPMALLLEAAVALSRSTVSTEVSCQVSEVRSSPGRAEVLVRGAERVEMDLGPGKAGLVAKASRCKDWQL